MTPFRTLKKTVFITNIVFRDFGEYSFQHEGKLMFINMTFFIFVYFKLVSKKTFNGCI